MLVVVGKLTVRPEQRENFLEAQRKLAEPRRTSPGYINFWLGQDLNDQNVFYIVEEWESPEAQQEFAQSPAFNEVSGQFQTMFAELPEVRLHEASKTTSW